MQLLHLEPFLGKTLQDLHPEVLVIVDVVVQQHMLIADGPHHPVGMSEHLVPVPGNKDHIALKKVLQGMPEGEFIPHTVLHQHLIRHQDTVVELDHIAPVNHKHRRPRLQFQALAHRLVRRNVVWCRFQIVRIIHVLQEQVFLQLNGHIVPRPHVLLGLGVGEILCLHTLLIQRI